MYRVDKPYFYAGFIVERGVVTRCAPILRKNLHHWVTVAVRLPDRPMKIVVDNGPLRDK